MTDFKKILIANRGEIAIRIMRAANELGKKTVAVYAEEDKLSLHRFKSDEAYRIGEGLGPVAAYLSIDEIIRVAKASGADAIHPGYGLLSENPDFVDACEANGITFIGPKAATMRALGDKASARRVAIEAGVPVIPATEVLGDDMAAIKTARGVPHELWSCHTMEVDGYIIEGHVPAEAVAKLLRERPAGVAGLAVREFGVALEGPPELLDCREGARVVGVLLELVEKLL